MTLGIRYGRIVIFGRREINKMVIFVLGFGLVYCLDVVFTLRFREGNFKLSLVVLVLVRRVEDERWARLK